MMPQTVLPFKLDTTTDRMTPHGGLVLFGEFLHAMDLRRQIDAAVPGPGSAVGYQPSQFVEPLLLMLHGGGQALEDLRQIRDDRGLRELVGLADTPSAEGPASRVDATGDWLRRMGTPQGLAGVATVSKRAYCRNRAWHEQD